MKREPSPYNPYKRNAKGKELSPGYNNNPLSPRERVRTRETHLQRYRLAGAAAEELVSILGGKRDENDLRLWAYYCYHHDIGIILDKAYELASMERQHELRNAVTAFQHWLSESFGKEAL